VQSGLEALETLERLGPRFHPDPASVDGALENQFTTGPREMEGAGGTSYAIGRAVLRYLAALPTSPGASVESGCGYSTVVLANVYATHVSVNPDLSSNRLVREFTELHCGPTGLRHVEASSDQGLPKLAADGCRFDLALIDGNHSHPFPLLDFHYMDTMLNVDGLLLIDNTEIDGVQELTEYLEFEPAYRTERVIGNCAVYRKVADRQLGWKSQVIRRPTADVEAVRREITRLRMEVAPELRASLTGANPLPGWSDAEPPADTARAARSGAGSSALGARSFRRLPTLRQARHLAGWYASPSGGLAGAALLLLGAGVAARGARRVLGVLGVALLGVFFPYRFVREQRRTDRQIAALNARLDRRDRPRR
jgi:hypothetical protein